MRTIPDFLVIGGPKCGSTSLWNLLRRNRRVFMPDLKEPAYFSNPEVFARGDAWYDGLFAAASAGAKVGEASTTYARWPYGEAPDTLDPRNEILKRNPSVRLVYVVRHPVERAYSHYGHHMRLGVHCTFEEALERRSIYVDCSRYDVQIDRWRESLSDPSQLLVVTTDELRQMDQGTLVRIQRHIGVEPCDIWSQGPVRSNERGARYLLSHRVAPFRRHPMVSPFVSAIPESARDWVRDLLLRSPIGARWKKATELAPMLPETRVRLLAEFEPATAAVERETGRTLEGWRR